MSTNHRALITRCSLLTAAFTLASYSSALAADLTVPGTHASLQDAVAAAVDNDRIILADGTYTLGTTLQVNKAITIEGQSKAGTIINAIATSTGWGINVDASNVTLKNFTVLPPVGTSARGTGNGGAFAIHAGYQWDANPALRAPRTNLTLQDITIVDSNRSAFDIHGFDGVTLSGLTATGAAYGNGINLSGCTNVTITGCTTSGNLWGGIAVYASKSGDLNRPSSNVNFSFAANSVSEYFYIEEEQGLVSSANVTGTTYQIDNDYGPPASSMAFYTNGDLTKATALAQGLNTKYSNSASVLNTASGDTLVVPGLSLQAAINAATPGDTITVSGAITLSSPVTLNKQLVIDGGDNATTSISGSNALAGYFLLASGASGGSTVKNISFAKTDKAGVQALIGLQAPNISVEDCNFTGQYVLGEGDVSRAFEISSTASGFRIEDCSITGLRQPAYINAVSSGQILNNYVAGTRGWVVDGGLVNFTGNTWGQGSAANATDIALLNGTPSSPLYDTISALSARNNNARVDNQRAALRVNNTTKGLLYPTIQAAINAADSGDALEIYPGTYAEAVTLSKELDIVGAGSGSTIISTSGTVFSVVSGGSGSSISGIGTTGGARGFNLNGVSNITLANVASTGNTSFGINFDGASSSVTLRGSSFSNNGSSGIKVGSAARVSNLAVDACSVNGNAFGIYSADGNAATYSANAQLNGITVNNGSTFSNNSSKGIFIESMNDGLFDGITVANSGTGTTGGTGSGIDINLKYANYSNLTIRNSLISNCGVNYSFGGGILIKARNDAPYNTVPATLGGTVLLEGLRVENCGTGSAGSGIRVGDSPTNVSPSNVVIRNSTFTGNNKYAVSNLVTGATVQATHNHWGTANGPFGASSNGVGGSVSYIPWFGASDSSVPPVLSNLRSGFAQDVVITGPTPVSYGDLYIAPGQKVTVAPSGKLIVDKLEVAPGGSLVVNGGSLVLDGDNTITGTFTIFNSFGSWNINGDTTFEVSRTLALISDIHVAADAELTVKGGGELILDGCVIDSQTAGDSYSILVEDDGLLTVARCVVSDAVIDIDTLASAVPAHHRSKVYDNRFTNSAIEASAASAVYHNLFDAATNGASNTDATAAFGSVDGWANVTDAAQLQNRFMLDFGAPALADRTLDDGNLFVQSGDAVTVDLKVGDLAPHTITLAEALIGYNSERLVLPVGPPAVVAAPGWEAVIDDDSVAAPFGLVDSALSLDLNAGDDGISGPATIGTVNFTAGTAGATVGFFRVQTDGNYTPDGDFMKDTRLTKSSGGIASLLTAFTANTGELVVDNDDPTINVPAVSGVQVQPTVGSVNILQPTTNFVIRGQALAPVVLTFTATDAGLAGLDADDAENDLVLTANNGAGTILDADDYTVTATESLGVVTYTVTLDIPAAAGNGTYAISAVVQDRSGNDSAPANLGSFVIANEVLATVELQGFVGTGPASLRNVTFVATGGVTTKTWVKAVSFTSSLGTVVLDDVPAGTTGISAKTAWTLRSKKGLTLSPAGAGTVALTGTDKLNGGDFNNDNVVNTLDYSTLRYYWLASTSGNPAAAAADATGDGFVTGGDYNVLVPNFYTAGDAQ